MSAVSKQPNFEAALRKSLPAGFDLEPELWDLIHWLEAKQQTYWYRGTIEPFMPTVPVDGFDKLWSHLTFNLVPDLVRYWFGKEGLESVVIPFVRCGGDGSYFAIWRNGEQSEYVFMGSEGEVFRLTDDVIKFIILITMGYPDIEGRTYLSQSPEEHFNEQYDADWPEPLEIKNYIISKYGVSYPRTGEDILSTDTPDIFEQFVEAVLAE